MADLKKPYTDPSRFICIYPAYINSKKTIAEGRRIPVEKANTLKEEDVPAVLEFLQEGFENGLAAVQNPTCSEIADVCRANKLNVAVEADKSYTRELNRDVQHKGRVRVQLFNEDGTPCVEKLQTRRAIMLRVAEDIPKLKTRTQKSGGGDQTVQQGEGGKKSKKKK